MIGNQVVINMNIKWLWPLLLLAMSSFANIAVSAESFAWVSNKKSITKVAADTGDVVLKIDLSSTPRSVAVDDKHSTLWVLTKNGQLNAYGHSGENKFFRVLPFIKEEKRKRKFKYKSKFNYINKRVRNYINTYKRRIKYRYKNNYRQAYLNIYRSIFKIYHHRYRQIISQGHARSHFINRHRGEGEREAEEVEESSLTIDPVDGAIWVAANKYLFKYSAAGTLLHQQVVDRDVVSLTFDIALRRVWLATEKTVTSYDIDGQRIAQLALSKSSKEVRDIGFVNHSGSLWLATKRGLQRYDRNGDLLQSITARKLENIAVDGTGDIWAATEDDVRLYNADGVLQFVIDLDTKKYRRVGDVEDIAIDVNNSTLWVLTEKSLLQFSSLGEVLKRIAVNKKQESIVVTGDITPPSLTIVSPVKDELVSRQPDIEITYEDVGLGVDVRSILLDVNGAAVAVDCTDNPQAATLTCKPHTDLTDPDLRLSLVINDFAGNASAAAQVVVKLDTDGDGYPDDMDTYPNDPTRSRLAEVSGITSGLQEQTVRIEWQPIADQANLEGYNIYRLPPTGQLATKLNTELVKTVNFTDNTVANGNGYRYRVTAVDPKGIEGEQGVLVPFFVAYNITSLENFKAFRSAIPIGLSWGSRDGFRYQIFRGLAGVAPEQLAIVDTNVFTDQGVVWDQGYRYQVATVADFVNVFTNETVSIVGPRSAAIDVPPLPPIGLILNDVVAAADGVFELLLTGQDRVSLTGTYTDALGTVDVKAVTGTTTINAESTDGTLRLVLPVIAEAVWAITVIDRGILPVRNATAQFRMLMDTVPPVVTIDGPSTQNIDADQVLISGTAIDERLNISNIKVTSDRFVGQVFGAIQGGNNGYSAEIPLEAGENILTVVASDAVGNEGQASTTVNRTISPVPELFILSPESGLTVNTARVSISGAVYSSLPSEQIRITLAGNQLFPTSGATLGTHHFTFDNIPLREGFNRLVVSVTTPAGNTDATTTLTLQTDEPLPVEVPPPTLDLGTTGLVTTVSDSNVTISGDASGTGPVTVTINGQEAALTGSHFEQVVDLTTLTAGSSEVTVTVTDSQGNTTSRVLVFNLDIAPPVISLTSPGIQLAPQVNRVIETPYILEGLVNDTNLSSFTINGQNVSLLPGVNNQSFTFSAPITLPFGVETLITLEATDLAGNRTSREIVFLANAQSEVEMVSPADGAEIIVSGANPVVSVVARVSGLPADTAVVAIADGAAPVELFLDGNAASGTVTLANTNENHVVIVEARDNLSTVIARGRSNFSIVNNEAVELEVSRFEPVNGETGVEPNEFILINLNKPIDLSLLQVEVRETAHGMTYLLEQNQGADLTELNNIPLVNVNRDQQLVPGGLSIFPGNRMVTFNPTRDIAYDANVFVNITYAGEQLLRTSYKIRPLPTFVQGALSDSLLQSLSGIDVEIPELGRTTTSDSDGSFSFGFGDSAENTLPGGRYRIVINPAMRNPRYGAIEEWVNIEKGRLTQVGMTIVPIINPDVPFRRIISGQPEVILADGNLTLDMSDAELTFANARNAGDVHVQFLSLNQLTFPTIPSVVPHWLYGVQPSGIDVTGSVGMRIAMPRLLGSHSYVPPDGTLVAMIGFDTRSKQLVPVGVGRIEKNTVTSVGKISMESLDYIGYALVENRVQGILQDYVDENISLREMITNLERFAR